MFANKFIKKVSFPKTFGMAVPNRQFNSGNYRYSYNGKEQDNEVKGTGNSLDFGARIYDSRVGRFLSIDPLAKIFSFQSNYVFAGNSPIMYEDKDGKFQLSPEQQKQYPKLTNFLKNNAQEILNNPKIMAALEKYGQMNKEDVAKAVEWNSGPMVNVTKLDGAFGEFSPNVESSEIRLNTELINNLENSLGDDAKTNTFLVGVTLFHELTHYGDDKDKKDYPGEEGELFETEVYGKVINGKQDAKNYLDLKKAEKAKVNINKDLPNPIEKNTDQTKDEKVNEDE